MKSDTGEPIKRSRSLTRRRVIQPKAGLYPRGFSRQRAGTRSCNSNTSWSKSVVCKGQTAVLKAWGQRTVRTAPKGLRIPPVSRVSA
jgi:hypothetical protein